MSITLDELMVRLQVQDGARGPLQAVRDAMDGLEGAAQATDAAVSRAGETLEDAGRSATAAATGAQAAAKAIDQAAASAANQDVVVTRAAKSTDAWRKALDPQVKLQADIAKAAADYAKAQDGLNRALAAGEVSEAEYGKLLDNAGVKRDLAIQRANDMALATENQFGRMRTASTGAAETARQLGVDIGHAGEAIGAFGLSQQRTTILVHDGVKAIGELIAGMPALTVAAQHAGQAQYIFDGFGNALKAVGAAMLSLPGVVVTATAALGYLGYQAETANERLLGLQNQLRATRADYVSAADAATAAARAFAASTGTSGTDSASAVKALASVPTVLGTQSSLTDLLKLSRDVAAVWNVDLPDAAQRLAGALRDPGQAAMQLAKEGFPGMSAASAEVVKRLDDQGHILQAQQALLADYRAGVAGAAQNLTPWQKSLEDLNAAFTNGQNASRGWGQSIGEALMGIAAAAVEAAAKVARALPAAPIDKLGDPGQYGRYGGAYGRFAQGSRGLHVDYGALAGPQSREIGAAGFDAAMQAQQDAANAAVLSRANTIAGGSGTLSGLRDQIELMRQAQALVAPMSDDWKRYQDVIDKTALTIKNQTDSLNKQPEALAKARAEIDGQTASNKALVAAMQAGGSATLQTIAQQKAMAQALQIYPKPEEWRQRVGAVHDLTAANLDLLRSEAQLAAEQSAAASKDQLDTLHAELGLVGASVEARNHELAVLKARQELLHASHGEESVLYTAAGKAALDYAGRVADATTALQHHEQVLSDVQNLASQAFDQIGNAIANAFAAGKGAVVSFASIARAAISTVLQEIIKLAAINPIINSLTGATRTTLADVAGLSSGGGGGLGFGGISNLFGLGDSLGLGDSFGLSGIGNSLGLSSVLGATLWSGPASVAATGATALYGGGAAGLSGASVTLGGLLGGAGAGFGAGTLLNSLVGGNSTGGTIGSAGGALAGAVIGSIVPGIGTLIGGLLGGAGGGLIGGLFGPGKANHGWAVDANVMEGGTGLAIGGSGFDKFDGSQILQSLTSQVAQFNQVLQQAGVTISAGLDRGGKAGVTLSGSDHPNSADIYNLDSKDALAKFTYTAGNNAALNAAFAGPHTAFQSIADLQNFITLAGTTIPGLTKENQIGSLAQQIADLNSSFGAAITAAQKYGLATDKLAASQASAIAKANAAAAQTIADTETGLLARLATATGDAASAAALTFDVQARQQRQSLSDQLTALMGDTYKQTDAYARIMKELDDTLAAERAQALGHGPNSSSASGAAGAVANLASYAASLRTGALSPLSGVEQANAARSAFQALAASAAGGDFSAIGGLQASASTFLTASRAAYGSGAAYVTDFSSVLDALGKVSAMSPDALTASVYRQTAQSQTDQLVDAIGELQHEVQALRAQVAQTGSMPLRLAS